MNGPSQSSIDEDAILTIMRNSGATADQIASVRAQLAARRATEEVFQVCPGNWYAFKVFCAMETQWRTHLGPGGILFQGLDFGALPVLLPAHRTNPHRVPYARLIKQLQFAEAQALSLLNRK